MIKSILFDFNGVIVDDEPLHMKAYQEVFGAQDISLTEENYLALLGADDKTFIGKTFERVGKTASAEDVESVRVAKYEKYTELISGEIPLFPGAENFVRSCANYFTLGIVSMASRAEIEDILHRTNLRKCFSLIVSAEDVDMPKPNPRCYKLGFVGIDNFRSNSLGEPPMGNGECLAIEDSPPGVAAARGAALKTLAVTNTVPAGALHAAGADIVTHTLEDWTPMSVDGAFR
jgi:beta-phosphoglucomutase-like phosphatase (HAD superfamily)